MRKQVGALMLAAALTLGGCGAKPPAAGQGDSEAEAGSEKGVTEVIEPVVLEEVTGKDTDEIWESHQQKLDGNEITDSFRAGLNAFAYESVAQTLQGAGKNVNYSPPSLHYALAMARARADGKTSEKISGFLGTKEREELATRSENIYRYLRYQQGFHKVYQEEYEPGLGEGKKSGILIADSLWANGKTELKPDCVNRLTDQYYVPIRRVLLAEDETWKEMRQWIKEKANGVLGPELTKGKETVLVLISTLYYYDSWKNKFPEEATKPDTLTRSDGPEVTADFMSMTVTGYPHREGDGYRVSMTNAGNSTSVVFVLLDKGRDASEPSVMSEELKEALNEEYEIMEVNWKMPRPSFGNSMKLKDTLRRLGAGDIFEMIADFSYMTDVPVLVSNVIQETHIGVDEFGVERVAYTMMVLARCVPIEETKVGDMALDRLPLFGAHSDEVERLFIGVVETP